MCLCANFTHTPLHQACLGISLFSIIWQLPMTPDTLFWKLGKSCLEPHSWLEQVYITQGFTCSSAQSHSVLSKYCAAAIDMLRNWPQIHLLPRAFERHNYLCILLWTQVYYWTFLLTISWNKLALAETFQASLASQNSILPISVYSHFKSCAFACGHKSITEKKQ